MVLANLMVAQPPTPESAERDSLIRAISGIGPVGSYPDPIEAATSRLKLADWIKANIDRPASWRATDPILEFKVSANADDVARILFTDAGFLTIQEVATALRIVPEILQVAAAHRAHAVVIRGTERQMAMGTWIFEELTKSAIPGMSEFPNYDFDRIRVFTLLQPQQPPVLRQLGERIRTEAATGNVFEYFGRRKIIVRGNPDQLAKAEQVIRTFEK
jgi:hypothetical protein